MDEQNYGYGLYVRKQAKSLKVNVDLMERHKECYYILLDILIYKEMTENQHPPLWTVAPRWEQDKAYWDWERYLSWLENRAFDSRK